MSVTVLWQGTIDRRYLRNKTKDEIIELYMGTLDELDKANGQLKRLCNCLCEFEDEPKYCGEILDDAIRHLDAYGLWPKTEMSLDQVPSSEPSIQPHSRTRPSDEESVPDLSIGDTE